MWALTSKSTTSLWASLNALVLEIASRSPAKSLLTLIGDGPILQVDTRIATLEINGTPLSAQTKRLARETVLLMV